jgi:penicillin-binding protein 2
MADAYATFANGGTRYEPEVAAAILSAHNKVIEQYAPRVLGHVTLTSAQRLPILEGLEGVVANPTGTAYGTFKSILKFPLSSYPIAGKTGTASNAPGLEPNSWFVGFAPANAPKYVVLCVVGQGGYGADAAAPVVADIFNYLEAHPIPALHLQPQLTLPTTTTTTATSGATTTTTTTATSGATTTTIKAKSGTTTKG